MDLCFVGLRIQLAGKRILGITISYSSRVDHTKLFFLRFIFFGIKLGHFAINNFFLYVTKMKAYQQKTEKFFVIKEKSLVGSTPSFHEKIKTYNFLSGGVPNTLNLYLLNHF